MTLQKQLLKKLEGSIESVLLDKLIAENPHSDFKSSLTYIYDALGISRYQTNKFRADYWRKRGYSDFESAKRANEEDKKRKKPKRVSPFSVEFWTAKGYTEEEAEYKRNSRRPIRKEYWLEKGYSLKGAEEKALETKSSNNKKGAKASGSRDKERCRLSSPRCVEYWLSLGLSETEAQKKVTDVQGVFSLEKVVNKLGKEEGIKRFNERQEKWQNTLNDLPEEEKDYINYLRGSSSRKFDAESLTSCINHIDYIFDKYPYNKYKPSCAIKNLFSDYIAEIHGFKNRIDMIENLRPNFYKEIPFVNNSNITHYCMWTPDGKLLRSLGEINFYELLKLNNISFDIEKYYKNTKYRCDFYLIQFDCYVEICGSSSDKYAKHMEYKKDAFGAILLWSYDEQYKFIKGIVNDRNNTRRNKEIL